MEKMVNANPNIKIFIILFSINSFSSTTKATVSPITRRIISTIDRDSSKKLYIIPNIIDITIAFIRLLKKFFINTYLIQLTETINAGDRWDDLGLEFPVTPLKKEVAQALVAHGQFRDRHLEGGGTLPAKRILSRLYASGTTSVNLWMLCIDPQMRGWIRCLQLSPRAPSRDPDPLSSTRTFRLSH
ncbi:MAG: hypothetical protein K6U03_04115 [Firmicutes bacterium]|nr:hypothetical protein [Bacillota bacterium]